MLLTHILSATATVGTVLASPSGDRTLAPLAFSFYTGDALLDLCDKMEPACYGYIAQVIDTFATATAYGSTLARFQLCISTGVAVKHVAEVAIAFIRAH